MRGGLQACWTWDDADTAVAALQPRGLRVLLPCDTGDLALALITAGAGEVVAVGADPGLLALGALKLAAARTLPLANLRALLGLEPGGRRLFLYHYVRDGRQEGRGPPPPGLAEPAATWWDAHEQLLRVGLAASGQAEAAATRLGELLRLAGLQGPVRRSLDEGAPATWAGRRFELAVRLALGPVLPAGTATVVGRRLALLAPAGAAPVRRALGAGASPPSWLSEQGLARLREGGAARWLPTSLAEGLAAQAPGSFEAVYLGCLPERPGPLVAAAAAAIRPGGRLLVRLQRPGLALGPGWRVDTAASRRLQATDQAVLGPVPVVAVRSS